MCSAWLRLYPDAFRGIITPLPPTDEQHAIAAFLGRETARIDALIAKVREAIETPEAAPHRPRLRRGDGQDRREGGGQKKAEYLLKSFVELHAHAIGEKVKICVEHFATHAQSDIGGKAKAMIVTRSRLHAVRYKLAVDKYLAERGYPFKALVAFSGTVQDGGESYTEPGMNGFPEAQTAKTFERPEYRFLIVANKFQTGFDQPLLHAMYVDKKLGGVGAVQTLSRLNRTHPEKKGTMVLDFANEADETGPLSSRTTRRRSSRKRPIRISCTKFRGAFSSSRSTPRRTWTASPRSTSMPRRRRIAFTPYSRPWSSASRRSARRSSRTSAASSRTTFGSTRFWHRC